MDTSEIIQRLRDLQIKQNKLFQELHRRTKQLKPEPAAQAMSSPVNKGMEPTMSEDLKGGDTITLLTNGTQCKKGDKAKVVHITNSAVHFTVIRNGHSMYKKPKNIRKV